MSGEQQKVDPAFTAAQDEWMEIMQRDEPLHEDLVPYLQTNGAGWEILCHPLVHGPFPKPYSMTNARYIAKKEAVEKAAAAGDWNQWLWLHEKPHRMACLYELVVRGLVNEQEAAEFFGEVWTNIENVWQYTDEIEHIVHYADLKVLHSDPFYESLPDEVTVYRGHQGVNEWGMSWTTDRERAIWFAHRFQQDHAYLSTGRVRKSDILFATNGRNESEIVVESHKLIEPTTKELK